MTREYAEEVALRLGARSLGVAEGASDGDVLAFDADGEIGTASPGGASSLLSVVGPFPFAFNDTGISEDGVVLTTIPAGSMVIRTWAIARTGWEVTIGAFTVYLAVGDSVSNWEPSIVYASGDPGTAPTAFNRELLQTSTNGWQTKSIDALQECVFVAAAFADTGDFTAGSADGYALIWTPT